MVKLPKSAFVTFQSFFAKATDCSYFFIFFKYFELFFSIGINVEDFVSKTKARK